MAKPQLRNSVSVEQIQDRSEAAKQPGAVLVCHPELVWQREQAQRSELCDPVPRWAGSQDVTGNRPLTLTLSRKGRGEKSFAEQTDKSLPSCLPVFRKCVAFTLAETLITLGIIGVVAALIMPSLIQHHKKQEASARLKKFYSMMQQAIMLSENEQGAKVWEWSGLLDRPYWEEDSQQMFDDSYAYWNKYLAPYIKTVKVEKGVYDKENAKNTKSTKIYFSDGSTVTLKIGRCMDMQYDINGQRGPNVYGKDIFVFFTATPRTFTADKTNPFHELKKWHSFDVPYLPQMYNTRAKALSGCKSAPEYCTTLLMYDNWEFKSDYPYKL